MSGADPPLVPGVVHGVRVWQIVREGGSDRLGAIAQLTSWETGGRPTEARCTRRPNHRAPERHCGCGLYALHVTARHLRNAWGAARFGSRRSSGQTVVGIVEAWGRVEVHRVGLRAEFARPRAIIAGRFVPRVRLRRLRRLAEEHGAELLVVGSARELERVCAERFPGLDAAFVEELLGPGDEPSGVVLPAPVAPSPRQRLARAGAAAAGAAGTVLGVLFVAVLGVGPVLLALAMAVGLIDDGRGAPARGPNRHLEVREQAAIALGDGGTLYVALVRNNHPRRAALGVFPQGNFRDADGEPLSGPDARFEVEFRPTIPPGQTGVVVDVIDDRTLDAGDVAAFQMGFRARAFRPAPRRAPIRAEKTRLDRRRCVLTTELVSRRALLAVDVAIVVRNGRGRISGAGVRPAGPVRRGRSLQVLDRVDPAVCSEGLGPVEAYPSLRPGQLSAGF